MKILKNITLLIVVVAVVFSCKKDEDDLNLDNVPAPSNVSLNFDIMQDNSGMVYILPAADGATSYLVSFGDTVNEIPIEYSVYDEITHIYEEGSYNVVVTAVGLTGLKTNVEKTLDVTFKAPENLDVTITKDDVNPGLVTVTATADFASVIDIYFGDTANEEPVHILPGESAEHLYAEPGDYEIRVVAKSGGTATTEYTETINIPSASDPVNLPITFESFTVNYAFTDFGNATSTVINNPYQSGINTSDRCAQTLKASGAEVWAGSFLTMENPIDFSTNKTFKVKVWSPKTDAIVRLKVENLDNGDIFYEVDATTTVAEEWEELSYDFSGIDMGNEYQKVVIFFDFGNTGDDALYYFDDVKLVPGGGATSLPVEDFEGVAPEFTVFGNIADIEVLENPDQSGINTTAHSAKLTKSDGAETWAGAFFEVETPLDLANYGDIKVDVWSPREDIVVKLKLENDDASVTHEVDLNTATSNTWEELVYDFSDAPAADYVRIVIFFDFGNPGDGTEYYYDEIELVGEGGGGSTEVIFQDFEGEAPTFTVFGNIDDIAVIANPDQSGANTTATVAQLIKNAGSETWAGAFFETDEPLDLTTYSNIKVKTWSPVSGITIKLKLENDDASITHEVDIVNTTANAWEEMVYDFSDAPAADYMRVVIFFDFGNAGDDSIYYFDEYTLTN